MARHQTITDSHGVELFTILGVPQAPQAPARNTKEYIAYRRSPEFAHYLTNRNERVINFFASVYGYQQLQPLVENDVILPDTYKEFAHTSTNLLWGLEHIVGIDSPEGSSHIRALREANMKYVSNMKHLAASAGYGAALTLALSAAPEVPVDPVGTPLAVALVAGTCGIFGGTIGYGATLVREAKHWWEKRVLGKGKKEHTRINETLESWIKQRQTIVDRFNRNAILDESFPTEILIDARSYFQKHHDSVPENMQALFPVTEDIKDINERLSAPQRHMTEGDTVIGVRAPGSYPNEVPILKE